MAVCASTVFRGVYIGGRAALRCFSCGFARKSAACISSCMVRDHDLRASLQAIGALQPGYEYAGQLIDGRRRKVLCSELGKSFEVRTCDTLQDACSTLFALHPDRAIQLAKSEGASSLLELATLCSTTPSSIAQHLQLPKKSHKRQVKDSTTAARSSVHMLRRLVTFEPELYALAQEAAREIGHGNFAQLVRDSVWRTIRERVESAPLRQPRRVQPANGARRKAG